MVSRGTQQYDTIKRKMDGQTIFDHYEKVSENAEYMKTYGVGLSESDAGQWKR